MVPPAPPYILTLRLQDRFLVMGSIAFLLAVGLVCVVQAFREGSLFVLLFVLAWAAFSVWFFSKSLRGPTQIKVLPGGRVCFRDWLNREREVRMVEIEEIRLQANLLTIKTRRYEYVGFSGFDGLHRFVHDVAEHNSSLVTKGI